MNEITDLREIQQVELGILRHLDQVCRENGLHFFLSNGTLLGAVKYEGFIPWDDDIDVFMPRCDYDRLMRLSGADSGPYRLLSQERTPGWRLPFAKLCDLSTCKQETCADFGADIGLDVDIFPLDAWSGGAAQARRCGLWRRGVSASIESRFLSPPHRLAAGGAVSVLAAQPPSGLRLLLPPHPARGGARARPCRTGLSGLRGLEPVRRQRADPGGGFRLLRACAV